MVPHFCLEGNDKGDVGHFEDIVPAYFCVEEYSLGESPKGIPDAEVREDRCLPRSVEGDP